VPNLSKKQGNLNMIWCAERQTASVYLKQLCEIGVLNELVAGKEKLFAHPKLITLMTQDAHQFSPYA
jgi:hypothetical protein